jgi:hypothetical protein
MITTDDWGLGKELEFTFFLVKEFGNGLVREGRARTG